MPNTIRQLLEYLPTRGLTYETRLEDDSFMIIVTSPDFTQGTWRHEKHGDTLLARGQGWKVELCVNLSDEYILNGIGEDENISVEPYLTYRSYGYYWPDVGKLDHAPSVSETVELLDILMTGDFPHRFFHEDQGEV